MIKVTIKNPGRIQQTYDVTFDSTVITPSIYQFIKANKRIDQITDQENFNYTNRAAFLQHYQWIETDPNNIAQHENPKMYFSAHQCAEEPQETLEQGM